ncbi:hypothetical protein [Citrobacter koseri]|uniref:hypothetical protein n=1 Tax=Citrobacter koseri TaxID=545 RepID=UPI0038913A66
MKLELRIDDKKLIEPDFKIYTSKDNKTLFFIVMKVDVDTEEQIRQCINNDEFKIEISDGILGLTAADYIYTFDIRQFINDYMQYHIKDQFSVAFAFLDKDDKIIKENVKAIRMRK